MFVSMAIWQISRRADNSSYWRLSIRSTVWPQTFAIKLWSDVPARATAGNQLNVYWFLAAEQMFVAIYLLSWAANIGDHLIYFLVVKLESSFIIQWNGPNDILVIVMWTYTFAEAGFFPSENDYGQCHVSWIPLQKGEKSLLQRRKTALLGWRVTETFPWKEENSRSHDTGHYFPYPVSRAPSGQQSGERENHVAWLEREWDQITSNPFSEGTKIPAHMTMAMVSQRWDVCTNFAVNHTSHAALVVRCLSYSEKVAILHQSSHISQRQKQLRAPFFMTCLLL
jgi:hypothetical protein